MSASLSRNLRPEILPAVKPRAGKRPVPAESFSPSPAPPLARRWGCPVSARRGMSSHSTRLNPSPRPEKKDEKSTARDPTSQGSPLDPRNDPPRCSTLLQSVAGELAADSPCTAGCWRVADGGGTLGSLSRRDVGEPVAGQVGRGAPGYMFCTVRRSNRLPVRTDGLRLGALAAFSSEKTNVHEYSRTEHRWKRFQISAWGREPRLEVRREYMDEQQNFSALHGYPEARWPQGTIRGPNSPPASRLPLNTAWIPLPDQGPSISLRGITEFTMATRRFPHQDRKSDSPGLRAVEPTAPPCAMDDCPSPFACPGPASQAERPADWEAEQSPMALAGGGTGAAGGAQGEMPPALDAAEDEQREALGQGRPVGDLQDELGRLGWQAGVEAGWKQSVEQSHDLGGGR
ncbi:hypothetical protein JHW43_006532 [Diplocarpon mali]|nr:hypothetical protein JHW43_006532 [Diplocarpon mali]